MEKYVEDMSVTLLTVSSIWALGLGKIPSHLPIRWTLGVRIIPNFYPL